ncbi:MULTISPECIES: hypothetical protein [Hymenobacter]|uniref:Uncharacterized protein n=1 Tax=Hymenobacter mucosus TaxID=1411120 RepID=A0A238XUI8_9BACT|nr:MULTISPECIES: hypothetical protein [Hymenobacter]SNR62726.1 hypothetical protein SAMN06269173_104423 [Hymenobacter mucosus]
MPLDPASFLQHAAPDEKTTVYTKAADGTIQEHPALLIAQTKTQKLFITLEKRRRYVAHTQVPDSNDIEIDFLQDYEEIEALMEDAGLDGIHDGEQGILYHNLLFLLMNP